MWLELWLDLQIAVLREWMDLRKICGAGDQPHVKFKILYSSDFDTYIVGLTVYGNEQS